MREKKVSLLLSDCRDAMKDMESNTIDSIITDGPYGLAFMGKEFDTFHAEGKSDNLAYQEAMTPIFAEALRVAKPGAHLLAFGGTRTYHRLACAIEDAGWEVRDCIFWCYGCLSDDTEIATPQGWKKRGEIKVGDMVIAFDRAQGKPLPQPVQRVFDYEYDDVAYRIVSPQTDQLVSKNHRVLTEVNGVLAFVYAEFLHENDAVRVPVYCDGSHLSELGVFIGHHKMTTARVSVTEYKGRMWCVSVPSGAIVARRNGKIFVTGNSGFPKSMDVSKAIDKMLGAEREKVQGVFGKTSFGLINDDSWQSHKDIDSNIPASPEAAAWQGFGTQLKPACEPIVVARKPLEGTVAANVLKYGTGAINIDGCRVPYEPGGNAATNPLVRELNGCKNNHGADTGSSWKITGEEGKVGHANMLGRWPANLIHDGSDEVLALFPDSKGQCGAVTGKEPSRTGSNGIYGNYGPHNAHAPRGDSGSAARFFYCAKVSRSERGEGNDHPTLKPLSLMRWLITLVTPPDGVVLDPFMGSGSTGVAARQLDRPFIGIEKDPHYFEIAQRRVGTAMPEPSDDAAPPDTREAASKPSAMEGRGSASATPKAVSGRAAVQMELF